MGFKASDFFLGIADFLGVLVPGAVLVFLEDEWIFRVFGVSPIHSHWVVFAAVAYILGQLLLVSTGVLNRLAKWLGGKVPFFRGIHKDAERFEKACAALLGPAATKAVGTAFFSALSFVRLKNADAAAEVDRHMAGYKLLRNLVAVFLIDLGISLFGSYSRYRIAADFALSLLFFMAFLRMLQWAHLLAFQYCILIDQQKADVQKQGPSNSSSISH